MVSMVEKDLLACIFELFIVKMEEERKLFTRLHGVKFQRTSS
jgi:hypothetical protein